MGQVHPGISTPAMTPAFGTVITHVITRGITSVVARGITSGMVLFGSAPGMALFIITSRISTVLRMVTPTLFHRSMAAGTTRHLPPIRTELEVISGHLTLGAIRLPAA